MYIYRRGMVVKRKTNFGSHYKTDEFHSLGVNYDSFYYHYYYFMYNRGKRL